MVDVDKKVTKTKQKTKSCFGAINKTIQSSPSNILSDQEYFTLHVTNVKERDEKEE